MYQNYAILGINLSILERMMKIYYNRGLEEYEIGWGQQYYLEYIYHHPGTTPQELADYLYVDKATITKLMKKLTEIDYLKIEVDTKDQRVRHLYVTAKADPAVKRIKKLQEEFYRDLTSGLNNNEIEDTKKYMDIMIQGLRQKLHAQTEK